MQHETLQSFSIHSRISVPVPLPLEKTVKTLEEVDNKVDGAVTGGAPGNDDMITVPGT